jgi:hypothetical protein
MDVCAVVKEEGPKALFKGNGANVIRIIPNYALKFSFNDTFKEMVQPSYTHTLSLFLSFFDLRLQHIVCISVQLSSPLCVVLYVAGAASRPKPEHSHLRPTHAVWVCCRSAANLRHIPSGVLCCAAL